MEDHCRWEVFAFLLKRAFLKEKNLIPLGEILSFKINLLIKMVVGNIILFYVCFFFLFFFVFFFEKEEECLSNSKHT